MISSGTDRSAWRTRNVPSALAANGRTSAPNVFVSETFANIKKTETNVTCGGTRRHATTTPNAVLRPTNFSFASAYPAGNASMIWRRPIATAIATVTTRYRVTGTCVKTSRYAPSCGCFGNGAVGSRAISSSGFSDVTTIQRYGKTHAAAATIARIIAQGGVFFF